MTEHPIQGLMKTAMESIKDMIDVNTVVGAAVEAPDGTVIIPISRVTFGFGAGGGDYDDGSIKTNDSGQEAHPFGGGSGAGVSVRPVGFLVCSPTKGIKFLPVDGTVIYDRLIDLVPEVIEKIKEAMGERRESSYMPPN